MTYEPFAVLLKPYWDMPLSGVPAALSTRTIAEGVYALWGGWDALGPEGRQSVAEGHDAMLDPARKGERVSICKLTQEIDQCLASIALWKKRHPKSITEAGAKETKLATLSEELATLQQRLVAPSREAAAVQPATELRPVTPATMGVIDHAPDPERRLTALRALRGCAKYARGAWTFKGIGALVAQEKANGHKRCDEKTIRADLKEAAQAELDARRDGLFNGLVQR